MRIIFIVIVCFATNMLYAQLGANPDFLAELSVTNISQVEIKLQSKGYSLVLIQDSQYFFNKNADNVSLTESIIIYPKTKSKRNDVVYISPASYVIDALYLSHISKNNEYDLMMNFEVGTDYQQIFERIIQYKPALILFSCNNSAKQFVITLSYED